MKRRNLIVTLTLSALFCTLIIIGSFIKIPMPNMMPMTLQTFFVLLAGLLLNVKASTLATITYMVPARSTDFPPGAAQASSKLSQGATTEQMAMLPTD